MHKKAITAREMSEIDKKAQEDYGISQTTLMENAGRSVSEIILTDSPSFQKEKIAIFCGKGNNGGDGFVVARYLADESPLNLTVYVTDTENITPGAAYDNFQRIRKMGLDVRPIEDFTLAEGFTVGVDAIFGTGFRGELPEAYASLAKDLTTSDIKCYAVDVPSGLDATTGAGGEDCFKAYKTITFGLPKQGFYTGAGPEACGEIVVCDIGFPQVLLDQYLQ